VLYDKIRALDWIDTSLITWINVTHNGHERPTKFPLSCAWMYNGAYPLLSR
jgi:hypothetical protein